MRLANVDTDAVLCPMSVEKTIANIVGTKVITKLCNITCCPVEVQNFGGAINHKVNTKSNNKKILALNFFRKIIKTTVIRITRPYFAGLKILLKFTSS